MRKRSLARARALRAGGYSAFAAAIVVLIAVFVNLAAGALPATYTQLDFTQQSLYTLSEQTRRIVKALDRPVTLTLLATEGQQDRQILTLLQRYADLSEQIAVKTVDPAVNPGILKKYEDEELYMNSVIVASGEKERLVSYNEIYVYDYAMDYASYNYSYSVDFDGERALTSAVHYVASDDLPKVYLLSGHGEQALPDSFARELAADNLETESLSLLALTQVPEDASCLILNAPQSDLSAEEAQMLIDYLDAGGRILMFTDWISEGAMANLATVTGHMGLAPGTGLVVEGDAGKSLRGYAYYLLPELGSHEITQPLTGGGYYALIPLAQPIEETGAGEAQVTSLLRTSDQAYAKAAGYDMATTEREEGDTAGPFTVGAASEKGEGRLVWFSSAAMLEDSVNSMVSGGNHNLALGALNWMCEQQENIAIHAKSLDSEALTLTGAQSSMYSIILVALVPAALLIAGLSIWFGRKRR